VQAFYDIVRSPGRHAGNFNQFSARRWHVRQ
jgi:hypothetical protein